jgi:hypothetical protein
MIAEKHGFSTAGAQMSIKDLSNFAVARRVVHTGGTRAPTCFSAQTDGDFVSWRALFALQFQSILTSRFSRR